MSHHAGAPVLVTAQFGKQNDDLYLVRRAAIELIGMDDIVASHYALHTGGNYREYLDGRLVSCPRLIRTDGYDNGEVHMCDWNDATHFPGSQPRVRLDAAFSSWLPHTNAEDYLDFATDKTFQ